MRARHAAVAPNIRRDAFEGHDRDRPGLLGHERLFGGHDVHDDAALEHLGETTLDCVGTGVRLGIHTAYCPRNRAGAAQC